jgi:hypothetical protein
MTTNSSTIGFSNVFILNGFSIVDKLAVTGISTDGLGFGIVEPIEQHSRDMYMLMFTRIVHNVRAVVKSLKTTTRPLTLLYRP